MREKAIDYAELNKSQTGAVTDPCTEYAARQAIRHCFPQLEYGLSVLDYGCSIGRASRVFKNHGFKVTGVDVIEERLEQAEKVCDSIYLRKHMKDRLPFEKSSFDFVFAAQLIEHLCHCDARQFLHEAYELLKPAGQIYLSTPNPHYIRIILRRLPMIRGCHLSCWSVEDLQYALTETGFFEPRHYGNGRMALAIGDLFPSRWIYGGIAVTARKPLS